MHYEYTLRRNEESLPFLQKPVIQLLFIGLLLLSAFGLRLYHINRPPLDFAPIRQYQNAHIARGLYFEQNNSISKERKEIAKLNMQRMGFVLEPRIIENAAVLGYRLFGSEQLWIPRLLSSFFWVTGGLFLFLIARRISSYPETLFSMGFYLFLPYSIPASRSFQPDPLMIMLLLATIYTILLYFEISTILRLFVSSAVASVAILIKPYCLFPIWAVFVFVSIHKRGLRRTVFSIPALAFIVVSFIPAFFHYVFGMLTDTGFLQEHARSSFLPHLISSLSFWKGWLEMIGSITGYLAFIIAMAGLAISPGGLPRTLLAGLWIGYLFFGLSATYQMHTHSYYHLPFIPIAALSLGPIGARIIKYAYRQISAHWLLYTVIFISIILGAAFFAKGHLGIIKMKYKKELKYVATVLGINPEIKEFIIGSYEQELRLAREIGEHVGHSTKTVFLTPDFGRIIAYYGELSGLPWPTSRSLYGRMVRGTRVPDISKDFTPNYIMIGYQGKYIKYTPDYFIITDFSEYEKQSDLKEYLLSNFPIYVKNQDYLIFDLRKMSQH